MAGTDVARSREGVRVDSNTTRPFSRGQPSRRSLSGGGNGVGAGLGQNGRSHTLDVIPGLGKGKTRNGRGISNGNTGTNGTNNSSSNNGNNNVNNNNNSHHNQNRQHHYQHKHSRAVASNGKNFSSTSNKTTAATSNNNTNSSSNHEDDNVNSEVLNGSQTPTQEANHGNNNITRSHKKASRRTVSLPKAGSRLVGHGHQQNSTTSNVDGTHRNNNNSRNNNNNSATNGNGVALISSATTHSNHTDSFAASGNNYNDSNNNVFPPIAAAGGQVLTTRLGSGGGANNLEGVIRVEQTTLSPRNLAGGPSSRAATRGGGGGVTAPTSPPEVPLSRLHFLTEPTFDTLQLRTPPILPHHGLVNGSSGGGVGGGVEGGAKTNGSAQANGMTGRVNGTSTSGGLRVSTLSPDMTGSQQQQQPASPPSSSEKAKVNFEKKVQLSVLTEGSTTPHQLLSSPRNRTGGASDVMGGSGTPNHTKNNLNNASNIKNNTRDPAGKTRQKKDSITTAKSLPKIAPPEEPFSIRRKIEQFRKWHEEQYVDKLARFEPDAATGGAASASREGLRGASYGNPPNPGSIGLVDYTKVLEGRIAAGLDSTNDANGTTSGVKPGFEVSSTSTPKPHLQHFGRGPEHTWHASRSHPVTAALVGATGSGIGASRSYQDAATSNKTRPVSAATWKTWRDVNTSDAYKDVKKYIRDNDLMDEEREAWIKSWIADVEDAMLDTGDFTGSAQRAK